MDGLRRRRRRGGAVEQLCGVSGAALLAAALSEGVALSERAGFGSVARRSLAAVLLEDVLQAGTPEVFCPSLRNMSNSSQAAGLTGFYCANLPESFTLSNVFLGVRLLLFVPLAAPILLLGYRQWRRRRSFAAMSNTDFVTLHLAAAQLLSSLGSFSFLCGHYGGVGLLASVGMHTSTVVFPGELYFHMLTCLDRYVAVVHPVAYLRLRRLGAARGAVMGCVWLLCLGWSGVIQLYSPRLPHVPFFCVLGVALAVVSSCSLAVLRALVRPGPGEVGGTRKQQVARSKRRAFRTVWSIAAVLLVYFLGLMTSIVVDNAKVLSYRKSCLILVTANWAGLPSSLVLPLLFLHRAGKLPCCHGNGRPNPHVT